MADDNARWLGYTRNREMSAIGYVIAALIAVLLLPLVPAILIGWVAWRLWRAVRGEPDEPRRLSWRTRSQSG